MKDIIRSSRLKILTIFVIVGFAIVSIFLFSDGIKSILISDYADLKRAEEIVTLLCNYDLRGYRLGGEKIALKVEATKILDDASINFLEAGGDVLHIVDKFEIVSKEKINEDIVIQVKYHVLADVGGGGFISVKDTSHTVQFNLSKFDNKFEVSFFHGLNVSQSVVYDHISGLLTATFNNKDYYFNVKNESAISSINDRLNNTSDPQKIAQYKDQLEKYNNNYYKKRRFETRLRNINNVLATIEKLK